MLVVTKGYGFSVKDLEDSCPRVMKPYEDSFALQQRLIDRQSWQMGVYVQSAVSVAIEHAFNGKSAKSEYVQKPILDEYFENLGLTQEEIDNREIQKMIAQERKNMAIDKAKGLKAPI